ncbi:MAG: GatB/YqeY domain-containing protein [Candidatus Hydrogenedentota bacterium]
MGIRDAVQEAMKTAMKNKDSERLACLRMAKGALLLKEKEKGGAVSDEDAVTALRAEMKKRRQTAETMREVGKEEQAQAAEREAAMIGEFLPQQLSEADLEAKVRAYLDEHPEITQAGRLTGALKKALGDAADGKMLNEVCRRVLEGRDTG